VAQWTVVQQEQRSSVVAKTQFWNFHVFDLNFHLSRSTRKPAQPKGIDSDASTSNYVTLTFDLLTHKVDHFMPLSHEPFVSIGIKISPFVYLFSQHTSC